MARMKLLPGKTITLDQFPTHIECTNNKYAPNKFMKITNQSIYNGKLNKFTRAIVIDNIQQFIISNIPKNFGKIKVPVKPYYIIYTVKNHGSIKRIKGALNWKRPHPTYQPNWDDDNLAFLWMKTIRDALTIHGVWEDDNVSFVRGGDYDIVF